jgi:hypothetical protein
MSGRQEIEFVKEKSIDEYQKTQIAEQKQENFNNN